MYDLVKTMTCDKGADDLNHITSLSGVYFFFGGEKINE